jgi:S-DNA-T family DNA segregation ATPase FtsK/SpoIIIE
MGAEALLGQGDMLYLPPGSGYPQRVHGAFVSDQEVHRVIQHIKSLGEPQYIDGVLNSLDEGESGEDGSSTMVDAEADPLYDQAVDIVVKSRRASISLVQRNLRIGYNRAARLVEQMEKAGIVTPMQSNGNREVLSPSRDV